MSSSSSTHAGGTEMMIGKALQTSISSSSKRKFVGEIVPDAELARIMEVNLKESYNLVSRQRNRLDKWLKTQIEMEANPKKFTKVRPKKKKDTMMMDDDLEDTVKKPKNDAFFIFSREWREDNEDECAGDGSKTMMAKIGEAWRNRTPELNEMYLKKQKDLEDEWLKSDQYQRNKEIRKARRKAKYINDDDSGSPVHGGISGVVHPDPNNNDDSDSEADV